MKTRNCNVKTTTWDIYFLSFKPRTSRHGKFGGVKTDLSKLWICVSLVNLQLKYVVGLIVIDLLRTFFVGAVRQRVNEAGSGEGVLSWKRQTRSLPIGIE